VGNNPETKSIGTWPIYKGQGIWGGMREASLAGGS